MFLLSPSPCFGLGWFDLIFFLKQTKIWYTRILKSKTFTALISVSLYLQNPVKYNVCFQTWILFVLSFYAFKRTTCLWKGKSWIVMTGLYVLPAEKQKQKTEIDTEPQALIAPDCNPFFFCWANCIRAQLTNRHVCTIFVTFWTIYGEYVSSFCHWRWRLFRALLLVGFSFHFKASGIHL